MLLALQKWNESGFMPLLCTYRLKWARRTSWGWWDDTALQEQDSKFKPWRSEAEHATSRSRRLPTILSFTSGCGRNISCFFQTAETGKRTTNSGVKGSGANNYPRAPALWLCSVLRMKYHISTRSRCNRSPETWYRHKTHKTWQTDSVTVKTAQPIDHLKTWQHETSALCWFNVNPASVKTRRIED